MVQFHKKPVRTQSAKVKNDIKIGKLRGNPEDIKVETLVREFLKQTKLELIPQNGLGDAIEQFIDKDDGKSVEMFVKETQETMTNLIIALEDQSEENIGNAANKHKSYLEELYDKGLKKVTRVRRFSRARWISC